MYLWEPIHHALPIAILTFLALLYGAKKAWQEMRRLRSPPEAPEALLQWQDELGLDLQKEPSLTLTLLFHDSLRLLLAVLCLLVALRGWNSPSQWVSSLTWPLYYGSIGLAVALSWFLAGASISFWFANWKLRPVQSTLVEDGLYRGQQMIRWDQLSHFQCDPLLNTLSFYSRKCPQLALVVARFPSTDIYRQAQERIAPNLGQDPPPGSTRQKWCKRSLLATLLLSIIPFFVFGLWAFPKTEIWVWTYYALVIFIASQLSARLIMKFS